MLVRWLAPLLLAATAGGVLLSNAFAYRDVSLAPRHRLAELELIGERYGGRGPSLETEFEEFGKHFLRATDPSGVSEAYSPRPADPAPVGGLGPRFGYPSELDGLSSAYVQAYPLLILRRSPVASRPPADYERIWQGNWYEVWERDPRGVQIVEHLPLGSPGRAPSGLPRCTDVEALARRARAVGAELTYVERPLDPTFLPVRAHDRPTSWRADTREPLVLRVGGGGRVDGTVSVRLGGAYDAWIAGSFGTAPVEVSIDDRRVGAVDRALNGRGQWERVGSIRLTAGDHAIHIVRWHRTLAPGDGSSLIGPVVLTTAGSAAPSVRWTEPRTWRRLCGRMLDWIEVARR